MTRLARLPVMGRSAEDRRARVPQLRTRYYAFLSYSHRDKELADWLHRELEKFRVPSSLAGKLTANGVVPRRLAPVFRDQQDLSAGADLGEEIKAALAGSQFLVVLCSPTAAISRWTNQEIESFKRTRPEGCVLAAVVAGEPFASDIPGREGEECFPPALRYKYDRRGHQTAKRAEPLAADFRDGGEGQRMALLKLVAGMLGVGLDELVQRDTTRRQRRWAWLAAGSLAGMAVTSTLAVTAFQARNEAREQRKEAEGLIGFMLGDLKGKLEPIGKLDALDGVGTRVLAYYSKIGTTDLSDAALAQRSKALSLMASVASARGDTNGSVKLYREAMAGTAEAVRRSPSDANALFDHAQNVFYYGEIAHNTGDYRTAESSMREYKKLALQMVALQPDNMKYRMEEQYAETNLGVVLSDLRRFPEATAQFQRALATMEAVATADPKNTDYQQSVAESLAWLADAEQATGNYPAAIAARRRQVGLLEQLAASTGDVTYQQRLIPAHRQLGAWMAEQGQTGPAVEQLRAAVAQAEALIPKEPTNAVWREHAYRARINLAQVLLTLGTAATPEASQQTEAAWQLIDGLIKRDPPKFLWREGRAFCWELRARVRLAEGATDDALSAAQKSVEILGSVHSGDATNDAYLLGDAWRLVGDVQDKRDAKGLALAAWSTGYAKLPRNAAEKPSEAAIRARLLERLGMTAQAAEANTKLRAMGYRSIV